MSSVFHNFRVIIAIPTFDNEIFLYCMEEYKLLNSYIFSGKFPVPLPKTQLARARVVYLDIFQYRPPTSAFTNKRTNPPEGFLGTITSLQSGLVLRRHDISFTSQRLYLQSGTDPQIIYAQRCIDEASTQRDKFIANLIQNGVQISDNPFREVLRALHIYPDQLNFVCYADSALKVDVLYLDVDICNNPDFPTPPPGAPESPSPAPPFPIPPGQPIVPAAFSPQPPGTDDDDYEPFEIDVPGDAPPDVPLNPPVGNECEVVRVVIRYDSIGDEGNFQEAAADYYAPIAGFRLVNYDTSDPAFNRVEVFSRGRAGLGGGACIEPGYYPGILTNNINSYSFVRIER